MSSLKLTAIAATACLALCTVVRAEDQVLSVRISKTTAILTVSDATSYDYAKAVAEALSAQSITDVRLSIMPDGNFDTSEGQWIYVIVEDDYEEQSENNIIICVSPETPFALASAIAESLTTVENRAVKFLSRSTLE